LSGCTAADNENSFVGYVEGEYIYISSPQVGLITSMSLAEGDSVQAGDVLFELDKDLETLQYEEAIAHTAQARAQASNLSTGARPAEIASLQARLEETVAQLNLTQSEFDRKFPLVEQGIIAESDGDALKANLERAKAGVTAAREAISVAELPGRDALKASAEATIASSKAAVEQIEWRLGKRSVRSRVSGRVEMIFRREGEFATVGAPVLAILPPENVKIRFFLPQDRVSGIQIGSVVQVKADGMAESVSATISFIAKEAEFTPPVIYSTDARQKLVFMVEARLGTPQSFRPGLPVDIVLSAGPPSKWRPNSP